MSVNDGFYLLSLTYYTISALCNACLLCYCTIVLAFSLMRHLLWMDGMLHSINTDLKYLCAMLRNEWTLLYFIPLCDRYSSKLILLSIVPVKYSIPSVQN